MAARAPEASYLSLARSRELTERAMVARELLSPCRVCPRRCGADRLAGERGGCGAAEPTPVATVCDHHGEEPPICGTKGAGTVFFAGCSLGCVYCQNWQISSGAAGWMEMTNEELARAFLGVQEELRCHNVALVSPSHLVPQILAALDLAAREGLRLPLVYNSNGYDSEELLGLLDGVVDIYLPDLKYADDETGLEYSGVEGYAATSRAALKEMYRQVGDLVVDDEGVARRGLLVRHLVLPNDLAGTEKTMCWIARELALDVPVSLMAQYRPDHRAADHPLVSRPVSVREYERAREAMKAAGLINGWQQELEAVESYNPDFTRKHPFE